MAKRRTSNAYKPWMKQESYPYPTRYGSHSSMIDEEETEKLTDESLVVLKDEHGCYTTKKSILDNGLADPKRYDTTRLSWNQ